MTQEESILNSLDRSKDGTNSTFIWLGNLNSYLIDCRLNIFRGDNNKWAIVAERLGYNPRSGAIELVLYYFGNCLTNLEEYNSQKLHYYTLHIIDFDSFLNASEDECLSETADFILVRGISVKLTHDKSEYTREGIILQEFEPNKFFWAEAGRLLVTQHRDLFRATDEEIYKSIPAELKKILVLDEWFHRDFVLNHQPNISDEKLRSTYEFNKNLTGLKGVDFATFEASCRNQEIRNFESNKLQWDDNRPSANETWQLIAKVISTGEVSFYKPTFSANTHWKNWEESGSL